MAIYPIHKLNKEGTLLGSSNAFITKEAAAHSYRLFLEDSLVKGDKGRFKHYYRLNATEPHTIEDYLAYDINCPKCRSRMKLVGRALNSHELGLYTCPSCNKR